MISLQNLEQRLGYEMPAFAWSCQPTDMNSCLPNSDIPKEIQIRATTRDGLPVPGSPWRLNGHMLARCGVHAAAKLICHEYAPVDPLGKRHLNSAWDKLAET